MSVSFTNQLTPDNQPTNTRAVIDTLFVQSVALAANSTAANTNVIDLGWAYPVTEIVNVQILIGKSASGTTNSKNVNATLQVSSDNSNWANSTIFSAQIMGTDNSGVMAGGSANIKLYPGCPRYIRAQFTGEAGGGTPVANGTLQLLF
jgi:hypothetical protein